LVQESAEVLLTPLLHDVDGADVGGILVDLGHGQYPVLAVEVGDGEAAETDPEPGIEPVGDLDLAAVERTGDGHRLHGRAELVDTGRHTVEGVLLQRGPWIVR